MSVRTLLIGLDGATFTVLDDLTAGGSPVMPFLAQLLASGARCTLRSTPNPLTPPAWVSLMTGRSPGQHGIFDFIHAEERGDDVFFTLYDARDCRVETIWSIAGRQNRRVAALNFPFTAPPPKELNGLLVPGFVPWRHLRRNCAPANLYDRLKAIEGVDPKELAWDFEQEKRALDDLSAEDREQWVRYHLPREQQWFRIAHHLLREEAPDLMAIMFDGVDKLQHQAWLYLDPDCQQGEMSEYHLRMRALCLEYFRQLDGYIEQLVSSAGPQAQVFLASDHGFTATREVVRINAYLHQKGYLKWREVPPTAAGRRREDSNFAFLDWEHTFAYCRTPSSNGIHIRVATERGQTGIKPHEYEAFRARLIRDLGELEDPATGERIIAEVHKREDVFAGAAMEEAPDLLLVLRDSGFVSIRNKLPVVEPRPDVAGTHHPDGVLIARGPGIAGGTRCERHQITDVGATLLYSLGLRVPADFEGRVARDLFTEQHLATHPVLMGASTRRQHRKDDTPGMCDRDKDQIMAQLQLLGYVE